MIEGGRADLESITREIRARRKAIAACYERALKARPTLAGKLVVRFSITAAGTISTVDIDDDTLGAPEVGACVRAIIRAGGSRRPPRRPSSSASRSCFRRGRDCRAAARTARADDHQHDARPANDVRSPPAAQPHRRMTSRSRRRPAPPPSSPPPAWIDDVGAVVIEAARASRPWLDMYSITCSTQLLVQVTSVGSRN